jgi:hypothetical protein
MKIVGTAIAMLMLVFWVTAPLTFSQAVQKDREPGTVGSWLVYPMTFDESRIKNRPLPTIPKDWRFIGVSNGSKSNTNTIWFQDKGGNIYLLESYIPPTSPDSTPQYILEDHAHVLRAK